jgi:CRISPR type IV-associated protein Csf3
VSWRLITTDADEVERLLQRITHLGRLRGHGSGEVDRWEVTDADRPSPFSHDGRITRALPLSWVQVWDAPVTLATAPPYWHPERQIEAVAPGTLGSLTPEVQACLNRLLS